MARIKLGKRDVKVDASAHTKGVKQGNARGNFDSMAGHSPDGTSTAERSAGIAAGARDPIDPRMPNLSPAEGVALPATLLDLRFRVADAAPFPYAAVPTLRFGLAIESGGPEPIRSIQLDVQVQIAARRRAYDERAEGRLLELFGPRKRWGSTLRTLLWTRTTLVVPGFTGATRVDLDVPCTYDFEVTATKYLAALDDGEVPLELLFSGTAFYGEEALLAERISWSAEADYRLPVSVWRETMDRYFPGSAWLRLQRDALERLAAYRGRHALTSWEATLDRLLERADDG